MERPSFGSTCPYDIKRYADRAKNYTAVSWPPVIATDNSGVTPNVVSTGVTSIYYTGRHTVTYNASDEAGNSRICKFYVIIEGKMRLSTTRNLQRRRNKYFAKLKTRHFILQVSMRLSSGQRFGFPLKTFTCTKQYSAAKAKLIPASCYSFAMPDIAPIVERFFVGQMWEYFWINLYVWVWRWIQLTWCGKYIMWSTPWSHHGLLGQSSSCLQR